MLKRNRWSSSLLAGSLGLGLAAASCSELFPRAAPSCDCAPGFACVEDKELVYRCLPRHTGVPRPPSTAPPTADDGGAMTDAAPPADPPAGSYAAPCPNTAPTYGAPCAKADSPLCVYAYAGNPRPDCDERFVCVDGDPRFGAPSTWFQNELPPYCTTPDAGNECPADYAAVAHGNGCSDYQLFCNYPEGLCACTPGPGINGAAGPHHPNEWVCAPPPTATPSGACPTLPPHEGMACSAVERECDYGSCTILSAPVFVCKPNALGNYAWTRRPPTKKCF